MNTELLTYKPFGENSILIEWPHEIKEQTLDEILQYKLAIEDFYKSDKVYVKSAYTSILVTYDKQINHRNIISTLKQIGSEYNNTTTRSPICWHIPVCYDPHFGIDLFELAEHKNCSVIDIMAMHSKQVYKVYFIGFLPGFLYLGGLDSRLQHPRKSNPRLKINKGSVAIGGKQTGIYPIESPAGWNIIGNSPIDFFNPHKDEPCFANPNDYIQFIPISIEEHSSIMEDVKANRFQIKFEYCDD